MLAATSAVSSPAAWRASWRRSPARPSTWLYSDGGRTPRLDASEARLERAEAVPIGDLGGGSHDLLACQTELASHQRAVTDSALAFTATFIASNPALVLLSSDERMKRTSSPSNDSLCVSRVPAPVASSSKR